MKLTLMVIAMTLFTFSCSHKKNDKPQVPPYSPVISFEEEGKKFEASVQVPKEMKDRAPLVILVHEWWGRAPFIQEQAQKLNQEGYATLVVDLFGDSKLVQTPAEAQALATPFYQNPELGVSRLSKYVEMAKKDPHVDPARVFVIGFCFGGTQALNLARSGAEIKGVVSFHGGLASTYSNKEIKAHVLALNGAADPMVPKKEVKAFEAEMKKHKVQYQVVNYPGALHAFTNPMATEKGKKFKLPIAYNKKAAEASWKELLTFLKK